MKMKTLSKLLHRFLLGCCCGQDKEKGKMEMSYILLSKWLDHLDKFLSPDFNQSVSPTQQSTKAEVDQLHKGIIYARGAIHSLSTSGASKPRGCPRRIESSKTQKVALGNDTDQENSAVEGLLELSNTGPDGIRRSARTKQKASALNDYDMLNISIDDDAAADNAEDEVLPTGAVRKRRIMLKTENFTPLVPTVPGVKRPCGRPRRYPRPQENVTSSQIPAMIITGVDGQTIMMAPIQGLTNLEAFQEQKRNLQILQQQQPEQLQQQRLETVNDGTQFLNTPVTPVTILKPTDIPEVAERASDQRVPEEVDEAVAVVDIIRDEFPPQFTNEPYGVSITDSQQLNVGIFSVQAFDPDLNNQGQLKFASIGLYPDQSFFDVNMTTGVVFVTRSLKEDGIGCESYTLRLIVYNSLDNRLQDTADVAITVNRNPGIPSWINAPYVRTVSELYSMGTPVLTVSAFDSNQDSNFSTALELAVRFGKTLIIQEVDGVEPVLSPLLGGDLISQGPRFEVQIGEKNIDYNEEFCLFLTTRNPAPEIPPDAASVITEVNFTTTKAGLTGQLLAATIQNEKPELEEKKTSLLKWEDLKIQLAKLEESLLEELANAKGNILENKELLDSLNKTKASSITIADSLAESVRPQASLDQERNIYLPLAENGSALYFMIIDLAKINMYRFSLAAFLRLFQRSLDTRQDGGGTEHRIKMLVAHLQQLVYEYVCRSLFKADRLMFAMHMVQGMKPDMFEENEWEVFTGMIVADVKTDAARGLPSWNEPERSQAVANLKSNLGRLYQALGLEDGSTWSDFSRSSQCEQEFPSVVAKKTSLFQQVLVVQAIRPDRLQSATSLFACRALGMKELSLPTVNLRKLYETETLAEESILVISPGADPSQELQELASDVIGHERYQQVAMGQGQSDIAMQLLRECSQNGDWLCLKKLHLVTAWLPVLEKELNTLKPHKDFRLWITAEVHPKFPTILLQSSQKVTYEFKVMVMDNGLPARSNEADVTIIIQTAQLPIFISTPYSTTVLETAQNNLQVFRVTATDADGQGVMVYDTIGLGTTLSFFYVENDGRILTRGPLRSDRALTYTLRVIAYDSLTLNQRATADVTIWVSRNMNSPEFRFDPYTQTIPEDFAVGDLILTVSAFDADNGKQKQAERTQTLFQICNVKEGILLCTDVAARGLDIPAIDWIVQFDPPVDPKEYIHRVGRTARGEGGRGHTLLILCPEELGFLRFLKNARVPLNEFEFSWSKISDIQIQETDNGTIGSQQSSYADIPVYYRKGYGVSPYDPSDREQTCLRYRKSGVYITELDNEPDLRETLEKDFKHTDGMIAITAGNLRKSKTHDSMTDEGKATHGQGQRPDIANLKIDIDESGYVEDERAETSDDKMSIMGNFSPTSLLEKNCKYGLRSTSDLESNGEQSESDRNNVNNDMNGANMDRLEVAPNLPTSRVLLTPPSEDDISTSSSQPFTSPSTHQSTKSDVSDIHSEIAEPYALEALETGDEREKMSPLPLDWSPRRTPEKVFRKKLILKLNGITNITHGLKTNTSSTCFSPDSRSRHNSLSADIENSISGVSSPEFELLLSESAENQAEVAKTFVQLEEEIHCIRDEFETISKKIEELISKYSILTDDQGVHIIDTIFERYPSMRVHQTEQGVHFDPMSSLSENNSHESKFTSDAEDKSGADNDLWWDFENLLDTVYSEGSQSAPQQHPKVKGLVVSEKSEQPEISASERQDSVFGNSTTHSSVEMDGTLFEDAFHLRLGLVPILQGTS